ncbi:hypothetical protein Tco_0888698 [Tanacetum coccineum]
MLKVKRFDTGALGHCLTYQCSYLSDRVDLLGDVGLWSESSGTKLAFPPLSFEYGMFHQLVAPLCISNDGKVILQYRSKLVVYDTHNSSSTKICRKFDGLNEICIFVENLVSPFTSHWKSSLAVILRNSINLELPFIDLVSLKLVLFLDHLSGTLANTP